MHSLGGLPALSPQQLVLQGFVHHLAPPTGRYELKQFVSEPVVDGHIELRHVLQLPPRKIPLNAHSMIPL